MNMDNPLERRVPPEIIKRAREFARDLAYGVTQGWWSTSDLWREVYAETHEDKYKQRLGVKWGTTKELIPNLDLLSTLKYVEVKEHSKHIRFELTNEALALLDEPFSPPSVFISYSRKHSSALALLIEARLKIVGIQNPFVDKNLKAGEQWHEELQDTISNCQYFVCLIGKQIVYDENEKEPDKKFKWVSTLDSEMVRKEIAWAEQSPCKIISIWHDGATKDANTPESLGTRHYITVEGNSALHYETALNEMLNSMGYSTY